MLNANKKVYDLHVFTIFFILYLIKNKQVYLNQLYTYIYIIN